MNFTGTFKKSLQLWLIAAIVFVIMLILNFHVGLISDDFFYKYIYEGYGPKADSREVTSIINIIESMKNHYGDYNGRVIIHGFLQFILMFGEGFAKVFNSAMYVLLGFLIYKHTVGRNRSSVSLFLGIYILMWFFLPQFGAAVLWLSGGANYVWASCIVLAALLPYRLYFEHISTDKQEKEKARYMWIIPLGFIGGSTSENIGGAVALAMLAAIVIYRILDIKIPKWSIAGFFSAVLGYVFLLLGYGKHQPSSKTDFMGYIDRLKDVFAISGRLYLGLLLVLVTVLILALTFGKREDRNRTQYIIPIWYIAIAMAAVGVMTFSVQRPDRAWFFPQHYLFAQ